MNGNECSYSSLHVAYIQCAKLTPWRYPPLIIGYPSRIGYEYGLVPVFKKKSPVGQLGSGPRLVRRSVSEIRVVLVFKFSLGGGGVLGENMALSHRFCMPVLINTARPRPLKIFIQSRPCFPMVAIYSSRCNYVVRRSQGRLSSNSTKFRPECSFARVRCV